MIFVSIRLIISRDVHIALMALHIQQYHLTVLYCLFFSTKCIVT